MPSVKLEGSITLPDGSTTGHFVINIPLLPTTVARHVHATAGAENGVEREPRVVVEKRHGSRHS